MATQPIPTSSSDNLKEAAINYLSGTLDTLNESEKGILSLYLQLNANPQDNAIFCNAAGKVVSVYANMSQGFTGQPVLCGSESFLGSWDPNKGLKPDLSTNDIVKTWTIHVPKDQMEKDIEFKLVNLVDSKWQKGSNTAVPMSQRGFITYVKMNNTKPITF